MTTPPKKKKPARPDNRNKWRREQRATAVRELRALLASRPMTRGEIAEQFCVTDRTVYRWLQTIDRQGDCYLLRSRGAPAAYSVVNT